ncbi:MAG: pantetheine-phosphate adenylyltransferase [Bacteroidetes bacterium]|nr:pantetheine-phosphate adenylyltransferase [Bacteroidota bacterium]
MERIAVFPGSFDPVTKGHESIIRRSVNLFDKLIIALGENSGKQSYFSLEERLGWLNELFAGEQKIEIARYDGLTVEFCRKKGAKYILRGLRTSADFEFERGIGQMNKMMVPDIETVFLLCEPEYASLSSSIVRDILRNGGDVNRFIPAGITLTRKFNH